MCSLLFHPPLDFEAFAATSDGTVDSTVEIDDDTTNGPDLDNIDYFGHSVANIGDLDGDGVNDLAVGANRSEEPNSADNIAGCCVGGKPYVNRGAVHILFMNADGSVKSTVEIDDTTTNGPTLSNNDRFGTSIADIGDLDGDGVDDLAVGAHFDDECGSCGHDNPNRGAVHILFMNTDGSVDSTVEINSSTTNGPTLTNDDRVGTSVANIGDLDGDGVNDLAVGATGSQSGKAGIYQGAVHIMFMNTDGSVDSTVEINSSTTNGPTLADSDVFGSSVANIGDLDGDGVNDLVVGAWLDDAGGEWRGAVHIMFTKDAIKPTVTMTSSSGDSGDSTSSTTLSYTVTFSESTSNFVVGDITVTGTANGSSPEASNFAGSGTTYTFDVVQGSSDGTVSVSVAAGKATDAAENDNTVSNTYTFTIDTSVAASDTSDTSTASTGGTCSRHVILGNCGTIAINNDEYRIINTWTNVPTTEVLVGQPVTVTLSTPNNPTHTKIHFASVHTEVFSIPANFDQTAHIDYSIMSDEYSVSKAKMFQVAAATHRITQDPDVKNLEMFEVVFTMIFAKPMDISHVVVETENKHGIPETLYLLDAQKVNENLAQALTLEEKSKFSIVDPEPEMDPEPEIEMDPEPEQTKKEKSKRPR